MTDRSLSGKRVLVTGGTGPNIMSASFAYHDIYPEQGTVRELVASGKLNGAFETAAAKDQTGAVFVAITIS